MLSAFSFATIGLEMGVSIFVGWYAGQWLDERFETRPWLMVVFLFLGLASGFRSLFRLAKRAARDAQDDSPDPPESVG
ncbi:MAG: AtpZ/AtpI family protein [Myxococcota bacterium]|nr:AtpZ/AtpI family protein [Myxococcota bacterium]